MNQYKFCPYKNKKQQQKKQTKTTAKLQYQCPLMIHGNFELYNLCMYI